MNNYEFYYLFYNNLWLFTALLLTVSIVNMIIYKRYIISIIDPLFYAVFFSVWATTVPCFLFALDKISLFYFASFLATQIAFFIGFSVIKPIRLTKYLSRIDDNLRMQLSGQKLRFAKWLFLIIGSLLVTFQLFSYWKYGIPIFAESRIGIYSEASGLGKVLKRVIDVIYIPFIVLTIFFITQKNKGLFFNLFTYFFGIFAFVITILIGSKSSFLIFVFAFFNYAIFSLKWGSDFYFRRIKKYTLKLTILAIFISLGIIFITEEADNPIAFLLARLAQSGDIFYMSYPNNWIEFLPKNENWVVNVFGSPLRLLGIIKESEIPQSIGFWLMETHHPEVTLKGPNSRMNVFGYTYLGFLGSIIYCFLIGFIASVLRNKLYFKLNSNILGLILYCLAVHIALKLEIDFYSSLADLINILLILPPIFIIAYLFSLKIDKRSE
jgi:hypothetical protein